MALGRTVAPRPTLVADAPGKEAEVRLLGRPSIQRRLPATVVLPEAAGCVAVPAETQNPSHVPLASLVQTPGLACTVALAASVVATMAGEVPVVATTAWPLHF